MAATAASGTLAKSLTQKLIAKVIGSPASRAKPARTRKYCTFSYALKSTPRSLYCLVPTIQKGSEPDVEEAMEVNIPLYEREAKFSVCSDEILKWKKWATDIASSVGTEFLDSDGGPDSNDLLREIEWLLEDALESYSPYRSTHEEHCISLKLNGDSVTFESPVNVQMRTSIDELYRMWSERVYKRRPFQYVVGCSHWRDVVLAVQEGVLIPRPVTEQLIDLAAYAISKDDSLADGVWADLGTGSGALAIGLGKLVRHRPHSRVFAVDLSPVALSVARYNIQKYNLQGKVEVRKGSWFHPLHELNGKIAGVLSNPPYIPSHEISGLQAEVGRHEPRLALDGGTEGINHLLHLSRQCIHALRPGGFLGFETNGGKQAESVAEFLCHCSGNSFQDVDVVADYAGLPSFVTAYRC